MNSSKWMIALLIVSFCFVGCASNRARNAENPSMNLSGRVYNISQPTTYLEFISTDGVVYVLRGKEAIKMAGIVPDAYGYPVKIVGFPMGEEMINGSKKVVFEVIRYDW